MVAAESGKPLSTSSAEGQVQPVIVLTGASSQLGVFLIPRLLTAGYRIIALSRQVPLPTDAQANPLWSSPEIISANEMGRELSDLLNRAGSLISCGPLQLAGQVLSRCSNLQRIVVFSTSSVFSKAESAMAQERDQIAAIVHQEKRIKSACESAGLDLVLLRPTLIYGCGLDQNISRLARWIRRFGWLPVAGSAAGMRQPVHAADLAELAVAALAVKERLSLDSPACGGESLSYLQMVERLFNSQGRAPRVIRTPPTLLSLALKVAGWCGLGNGANPEMVRRQGIDLVFDDSELKRKLAYSPRPFAPASQDFEIPAEAEKFRTLLKRTDSS